MASQKTTPASLEKTADRGRAEHGGQNPQQGRLERPGSGPGRLGGLHSRLGIIRSRKEVPEKNIHSCRSEVTSAPGRPNPPAGGELGLVPVWGKPTGESRNTTNTEKKNSPKNTCGLNHIHNMRHVHEQTWGT